MIEKITKLIEVKKIIALVMTILFAVLALRGDIDTNQTMTIVTMIMTYYFTQSINKEMNKTK